MIVYIYGLVDPRFPDAIRYVGKTIDQSQRLAKHLAYARNRSVIGNSHLLRWLRQLLDESVQPVISILETTGLDNWETRERHWIALLRTRGQLLNISDGGNGPSIINDETRRRMSASRIGKKHSLATRRKISESQVGNKRGPETSAKIRAKALGRIPWNKGRQRTEEERVAISEACRAGWAKKRAAR